MITQETKAILETRQGKFSYYNINNITRLGINDPSRLPFSIKILLENALRNYDGFKVTLDDIRKIASWSPYQSEQCEVTFNPGRVILQDFTGVPCVVDLAAMRSAMLHLGGDIAKVNPQVRCDLVIDHSLQVDCYGCEDALQKNMDREFDRNQERYEFLKWGQKAFRNFSVIPPGTGIIHQINLEYLAEGILKKNMGDEIIVFPDSVVGTDSHTTMINGLGILGWGVGGIEAEAVMLGEPITMILPEVIGFKLTGRLKEGVTATDLVLTIVEMLRKKGVVGKFVEYYGDGLNGLTLPDRAMIANMAPEYGATVGFFPVDETTLSYYTLTGRDQAQIDLIRSYLKEQGMFYTGYSHVPDFNDHIELDLSTAEPCLAGPKRPQDRIRLVDMKRSFENALAAPVSKQSFGLSSEEMRKEVKLKNGETLRHGSVVVASITSCTNTSNPSLLFSAGLLAKNAVEKGLKVASFIKTSFAPGSLVVEDYLKTAGLMPYLTKLGFHIIGYGCATCIGNTGPLDEEVARAIDENHLIAAAVLSGNRNFEGRISPHTKANYLASPPLVVAYALAGTIDIDFNEEPIGRDHKGREVYLKDIWPDSLAITAMIKENVHPNAFQTAYARIKNENKRWDAIRIRSGELFEWNGDSTYLHEPPFFDAMDKVSGEIKPLSDARVLVKLGDSVTTDHISPAGSIAKDSPAGKYLQELGVEPADFNSYGSRRGNDQIMVRGTFANIRLRNDLAPGTEGSWTVHFPSKEKMSIFEASRQYKLDKVPLIVLAGKEYGTGSSRDWAAKGPALLGIKVVIAESYERIHRSNLAGMGILPLEYVKGESAVILGLTGDEVFDFPDLAVIKPGGSVKVIAKGPDKTIEFQTICRLDTPVEIEYFRQGGILQTVLRKLL
ncbi:MAG: aconitate hydratase AcnA [Candidatus Omnitrophota bacterium]